MKKHQHVHNLIKIQVSVFFYVILEILLVEIKKSKSAYESVAIKFGVLINLEKCDEAVITENASSLSIKPGLRMILNQDWLKNVPILSK